MEREINRQGGGVVGAVIDIMAYEQSVERIKKEISYNQKKVKAKPQTYTRLRYINAGLRQALLIIKEQKKETRKLLTIIKKVANTKRKGQ